MPMPEDPDPDDPPEDEPSSLHHSMTPAAAAALRAAMVDLRDEARAVVELRIFERLPFDEIARRVGRNRPETVKAIFHRSLARMRGDGNS